MRPPICPKPDEKILFTYRIKISMEYTHTYTPRNFILKLHFVYCIQYPKFFSRNYGGILDTKFCIQLYCTKIFYSKWAITIKMLQQKYDISIPRCRYSAARWKWFSHVSETRDFVDLNFRVHHIKIAEPSPVKLMVISLFHGSEERLDMAAQFHFHFLGHLTYLFLYTTCPKMNPSGGLKNFFR